MSCARSAAPRLSVAVITKNEADRIERCLRSVDFADEIVIVDSGSGDGTVVIAAGLGADTIVTPDWPGFGVQKNRALARCRGEWVLSIDADEEVSAQLRDSILAVVDEHASGDHATGAAGYWIDRRSRFCGQVMHYGLWRGDRVLRLFRRNAGRFSDDLVHERVLVDGEVGRLTGLLHHDSVDSMRDARDKAVQYARLGAIQLRAKGRGGRVAAWTHGGWTFVRGYLIKLGLLDGRNGLALAWYSALGTYLRYKWAGEAPPAGAALAEKTSVRQGIRSDRSPNQ